MLLTTFPIFISDFPGSCQLLAGKSGDSFRREQFPFVARSSLSFEESEDDMLGSDNEVQRKAVSSLLCDHVLSVLLSFSIT